MVKLPGFKKEGASKAKNRIGLDIGNSSIKIVELQKVSGSRKLLKFAIEAIPSVATGAKPSKEELVDTIKAIHKRSGVSGDEVVSSLSSNSVIVRIIELPKMTEEELGKAIGYHANQYIPYNIDDSIIDFNIVSQGDDSEGKMIKVLLVAANKNVVNEHIQIVKESGLTPVVIDVDSFAVINCFANCGFARRKEDIVALLDIGSKVTHISVLQGGDCYFTREISLAGDDITEMISKSMQVGFHDAERLKKEEGFIFDEEKGQEVKEQAKVIKSDESSEIAFLGNVSDVVKPIMIDLVNELRLSFDYYEDQAMEKKVGKIYLSGGSARLRNLDKFIEKSMGIQTLVWNPLEKIELCVNESMIEAAEESSSLLATAVGLGLR